jgi:hypothetical protein
VETLVTVDTQETLEVVDTLERERGVRTNQCLIVIRVWGLGLTSAQWSRLGLAPFIRYLSQRQWLC